MGIYEKAVGLNEHEIEWMEKLAFLTKMRKLAFLRKDIHTIEKIDNELKFHGVDTDSLV